MRALTVVPGQPGSAALAELPEPKPAEAELPVDGLALGARATDREIAAGDYGWAPPGSDAIVEATGVPALVLGALAATAAAGIVCLVGVSRRGHTVEFDAGALSHRIVLQNDVVFGSVNANLRHYRLAAAADRAWLEQLITRRVALERFAEALESRPEDIKVVIDLGS